MGAETAGSFDPATVHINVGGTKPGSRDRGLWAINDEWHPEVSDECAFDPACSTDEAWRLSAQGTGWTAWNTFTNKAYEKYLPLARVAADAAKRARAGASREAALTAELASTEADLMVRTTERNAAQEEAATCAISLEALTIRLNELQGFVDRFTVWVDSIRQSQ